MKIVTASVIIPVYNAESTISACLDSLLNQSETSLEIICIDDGSIDKTTSIIDTYTQQHGHIFLYTQDHQGPAVARNYGAQQAKADILVFVDADMTFDENFVTKLIAPIQAEKVKGTFSKQEYVANWNESWARFWNYEYTGSTTKSRLPESHPDTSPVFRAILKAEFDKVNGFDATGYTDDWTLSQKLGYPAVAAPGAVMYHDNPSSLDEVIAQAVWIGKRQYKLGEFGRLIALIRANPVCSLLVGLVKSIRVGDLGYVKFKFVYNAGITGGILMKWMGQGNAK